VKLKRLHIVRLLLMALIVLTATTSCYNYDEVEKSIDSNASDYINVTISISASDNAMTRAVPTGGEYGDATEKGNNRENEVKNITLIFYQDPTGINTTSDDAAVVSVLRYAVRPMTDSDWPEDKVHSHKGTEPVSDYYGKEVLYTTGNQKLNGTLLEKGETYKMLVVANTLVDVSVGDKIKNVREKVASNVFTGTGIGINASDFVMASETDASVTLSNPEEESISGKTSFIYYFDCIHIERLAARIDFWADKSNGYKTSTNNPAYTTPGYEYIVKKADDSDSGDRFVLTSITPFNLNNGNEFVFKRTNDTTNPYLHDESTTNWVVDPNTSTKNGTAHPSYLVSTLTDVRTTFSNAFNVTMGGEQANKLTIDSKDDIIIGYTKENTLRPDGDSPLYYYATGLAFEGYYYENGTGTGERCVYYYFIRHQGENSTAYDAYTADNIESTKAVYCPSTPAMNFGIVRNNIYRISIDKVLEKDGAPKIKIKIEEEKWRHVDNPEIYI